MSAGIFHIPPLGSHILCVGFISSFPDGGKEVAGTNLTSFWLTRPTGNSHLAVTELAHDTFKPGHIIVKQSIDPGSSAPLTCPSASSHPPTHCAVLLFRTPQAAWPPNLAPDFVRPSPAPHLCASLFSHW